MSKAGTKVRSSRLCEPDPLMLTPPRLALWIGSGAERAAAARARRRRIRRRSRGLRDLSLRMQVPRQSSEAGGAIPLTVFPLLDWRPDLKTQTQFAHRQTGKVRESVLKRKNEAAD